MASVPSAHLPTTGQDPDIHTFARIFLTFLVLFYVVVCFYFCFRSIIRRTRSIFRHAGATNLNRHVNSTRTIKLDDQSVVASLPMVVYQDIKGMDGVLGECPICLSAVGDVEMVRMLPNCEHLFHVECIDMWLSSHLTCPVCRAGIGPVDALNDLSSPC